MQTSTDEWIHSLIDVTVIDHTSHSSHTWWNAFLRKCQLSHRAGTDETETHNYLFCSYSIVHTIGAAVAYVVQLSHSRWHIVWRAFRFYAPIVFFFFFFHFGPFPFLRPMSDYTTFYLPANWITFFVFIIYVFISSLRLSFSFIQIAILAIIYVRWDSGDVINKWMWLIPIGV